jgi:HEAT repeat protein
MRRGRGSASVEHKAREKVERFIRAVRSHNSIRREKATKSLLRSASKEAVLAMIELLKGRDAELRMAALGLLKQLDSDDSIPVTALLAEDDPFLRIAGCEILTLGRQKKALPLLVARLEDENPNVRNAACVGLGELQDDRAVDALLGALGDEEWIAFSAIYSLGKIGSRRSIPYLWKAFVEREGVLPLIACEVLLAYKDRAISHDVFIVLKGWHERKRDMFIRTILEREEPRTLDELYDTLGEVLFGHLAPFISSLTKRSMQLMRLIARFKRRESCDFLLDVLKNTSIDDDDFDELVGFFASLQDVWCGHVAEYLDKEQAALLPFIRACGVAGQKVAEKRLEEIFLGASLDLKREIIRSLPEIIEQDGATILRHALHDEDGHVKGDAALAAARLCLRSAVPDILDLARVGFADVRKKALQALVALGDARATELVESFVAQGSSEDKKVALSVMHQLDKGKAFEAMKALLDDPDEMVLRSAIYTAGRLVDKDERYLELLNRLLAERPVLHELIRVIRERKLDSFKDRLVELFLETGCNVWTRYEILAALAVLRDHSLFDVFAGGLRDENTLIKIGSIKALSDLSDVAAISHVKPFARSQDAALRSIATAALKQLQQVESKAAL